MARAAKNAKAPRARRGTVTKMPRGRKARDLGNTNPEQAAKAGWVVDKGDPGAWETVCKAHNDDIGMMKCTKRMKVPGGYIVQATTEGPKGYAEAVTYVPCASWDLPVAAPTQTAASIETPAPVAEAAPAPEAPALAESRSI